MFGKSFVPTVATGNLNSCLVMSGFVLQCLWKRIDHKLFTPRARDLILSAEAKKEKQIVAAPQAILPLRSTMKGALRAIAA